MSVRICPTREVSMHIAGRQDLGRLAAHAAVELESYCRKTNIGFRAVEQLAARIGSLVPASTDPSDPSSRRSLFDPVTEIAMHRAVTAAALARDLRTVGDLNKQAHDVAGTLRRLASVTKDEDVQQMKAFCLAFSTALSTLQASTTARSTQHPYRK